MMMRVAFIACVAACLVAFSAAVPSKNEAKKLLYDCSVTFLKEKDSLDKYFKYVPDSTDGDDCDETLDEFREKAYDELKKQIEEDADLQPHTDCMMEKLKLFKIDEPYMEKLIYSEDKTMSKIKRQHALSGSYGGIDQKIGLAEDFCAPTFKFGTWFDELYDKETTNSTDTSSSKESDYDIADLQEDYCQRKHIIDKKLIDLKVYNVTVNPKHIDVKDLKCDKFWFEPADDYIILLKNEFESGFVKQSKRSVRCIVETIRNASYPETVLRVWMLGEVEISEKQKALERTAFVNFMTNLYDNIMNCEE